MKKVFRLQNLDCAVCANKMERAAAKIAGVKSVSVNFMTLKMFVEAEDERFNEIMAEIERMCRKVEPDCKIIG